MVSQDGLGLTHPAVPGCEQIEHPIRFDCETSNILIDPAKTGLLSIDMQNITLSSAYSPVPAILFAKQSLLKYTIPAARKLGL
jgi:hypothetical protein